MFRSMFWKSIKNRSSLKTKARRDPGFFHGSFTHRGLSRFDRSRMALNVLSGVMIFLDNSSMATAFARHSALYCSNSCVFMGEIYKNHSIILYISI